MINLRINLNTIIWQILEKGKFKFRKILSSGSALVYFILLFLCIIIRFFKLGYSFFNFSYFHGIIPWNS
ncbi:MAG: hypothetical protein CVT88_06775 [Candidatus Altiarchaeales archaeon HGW-Altiarchaeales-1]|nr:MAG: hypothetical protein CVT88_06775 [Candidatus Altiarchaeales archaeon HGW-Altiarchaeales-1]